jgi:hypothetical protein
MTSAEWNEAFDKGDPERMGRALLAAIRQAHEEQDEGQPIEYGPYGGADIGELAPMSDGTERPAYVLDLCTRAAAILRDQG